MLQDLRDISSAKMPGVRPAVERAKLRFPRARSRSASSTWPATPALDRLICRVLNERWLSSTPVWRRTATTVTSASSGSCGASWTASRLVSQASSVKEGGPIGAGLVSMWFISASALGLTTSGALTKSFERACTWKFPSSSPSTKTTKQPTASSVWATEDLHQPSWTAASWANCSVCSGPSTRALFSRTEVMVRINVGPEMWETVSHVPGTEVREHFRSIRLLASRYRNSRRSASFPTASVEDLEHTRSSNLDRAESPATTAPLGASAYVRPPHSKLKTDTLHPMKTATVIDSRGLPLFTSLTKNSSTNWVCTVRSVSDL